MRLLSAFLSNCSAQTTRERWRPPAAEPFLGNRCPRESAKNSQPPQEESADGRALGRSRRPAGASAPVNSALSSSLAPPAALVTIS
ncbi:unnamed protein product [Caenorhabditis auriculariae]|uniref:Uncharacterized protein n=1 Tax=Caenorhabditis auriculariae TaxID=2777116 RepID=A0A8S1HCT7_9PELO|nr:unnamed protein product [Caenorhabditis auriculariae]